MTTISIIKESGETRVECDSTRRCQDEIERLRREKAALRAVVEALPKCADHKDSPATIWDSGWSQYLCETCADDDRDDLQGSLPYRAALLALNAGEK